MKLSENPMIMLVAINLNKSFPISKSSHNEFKTILRRLSKSSLVGFPEHVTNRVLEESPKIFEPSSFVASIVELLSKLEISNKTN